MLKSRFITLIAAAFLLAPAAGFAQTSDAEEAPVTFSKVEAVTLYPSAAKVEVKAKAVPERLPSGEVVLVAYLPGYAYPGTLSAYIDGKLTGMNIEQLSKDDNDDPILAPWKAALLNARNEYASIQAEQEAVQARIDMWSNPGMPQANIGTELERLDTAMQAGLKAATARALELAPMLEEAQKKINIAENQLNSLRPSYKVSFVLAQLRTGSDFTYTYMLGNCGWQPSYTLNALPDAGKVELGFSAEITQSSGFDWQDVKVSLATNAPRWDVTPPNLDYWYIGQVQTEDDYRSNKGIAYSETPQAEAVMDMEINDSAGGYAYYDNKYVPQESMFATYSIWDMGKRTLLHDKPAVFAVMDDTLLAEFLYTARPKVSDQAFLTAELKPVENERILPRAEAVYMVEGNTVGNGSYPIGDSLYFGTDPLIKVNRYELTNQSDERGLIGKTKVRNWHWKYEVENLGNKPIIVKVEDSIPSLADKRMEIVLDSTPAPETDRLKSVYVWRTTLDPKAKFEIEHKVEATAPSDIGLDSSR